MGEAPSIGIFFTICIAWEPIIGVQELNAACTDTMAMLYYQL